MGDAAVRARILLVVAVVVVALIGGACGDDGSAGDADASPVAAPPTATGVTRTEYPFTLTDMLGRNVRIAVEPQKVAALSPSAVEYVYAVGGTSLTRSDETSSPAEVLAVAGIGPARLPNLGIVAAAQPDLIVADSVQQPDLEAELEQLGVPVLFVGARSYDDAIAGIELIGRALNRNATAAEEVKALRDFDRSLQTELPAGRPNVLVLMSDAAGSILAATPRSYAGDMLRVAGGRNVAPTESDAPDGFAPLTVEEIVAAAPDIILLAGESPLIVRALTDAPSDTPAEREQRVLTVSRELLIEAPGPRASAAVTVLVRLLYPILFGE